MEMAMDPVYTFLVRRIEQSCLVTHKKLTHTRIRQTFEGDARDLFRAPHINHYRDTTHSILSFKCHVAAIGVRCPTQPVVDRIS